LISKSPWNRVSNARRKAVAARFFAVFLRAESVSKGRKWPGFRGKRGDVSRETFPSCRIKIFGHSADSGLPIPAFERRRALLL
jgi:hypothetical protein